MTNIFIFNNASRAAGYGIGTYVEQLSECLSVMPSIKVSFVEMNADTKEFSVIQDDKRQSHYLIPKHDSLVESEDYCRIVFYFLARNIETCTCDNLVFQFNYFQHYPLAILLKSRYPDSLIVQTVHYMYWAFELNGNVQYLRKITSENHSPSDYKEQQVISSFNNERLFLNLSDIVFALSKSTREILTQDYKVASDKVHLVYNGIGTKTIITNERRNRTILFVGRLEEEKGLKYLIDAFAQISEIHKDATLVIVGDGNFQNFLSQSRKLHGRVVFFGKMKKEEIEGVYQSAYIGVIPSFHEQCSYTAIEMMRHGIPIIGTNAIGLNEMLDVTPELQVNIDRESFNEENFVSQIASRMDLLLSDEETYKAASDAVRSQYKKKYTITIKAEGVKKALSSALMISGVKVSSDYLSHIDDYMIWLIN